MKLKNIGFTVILLLFVGSGFFSWKLYFKTSFKQDTVNIHSFPKKIGAWTSEEMTITEDEYAILETKNAFVRKYTNTAGDEVFLFIVYSENNRKVAHPPEVCYTGGGVSIVKSVHDTIDIPDQNITIDANRLSLESGRDKQVSYYWFKVGDSFTSNYWRQQMLIAFKTLKGEPSSSALIRVSATVRKGDEENSAEQVKKFTRRVMPDIFKYLP